MWGEVDLDLLLPSVLIKCFTLCRHFYFLQGWGPAWRDS